MPQARSTRVCSRRTTGAGAACDPDGMIREPAEVVVREDGSVELPMGILVEAGLAPGARLLAYSEGDGRIVLRREADALEDLLNGRPL